MELTEIVPGLYQSGAPVDAGYRDAGIDVVIDLEGDMDAVTPRPSLYVYWPIEDAGMPDAEMVRLLARAVRDLLTQGHKVLVHCAMGYNRSGLINARALILMGHAPEAAIALVRSRRGPQALSNANFTSWLMKE